MTDKQWGWVLILLTFPIGLVLAVSLIAKAIMIFYFHASISGEETALNIGTLAVICWCAFMGIRIVQGKVKRVKA